MNRLYGIFMDREIRILVAEEDLAFLKMIQDSLKESGGLYHIERVDSGEESFGKLQHERFDILLLDYLLPDGKGLTWLQRFNEAGIGIPTIFVTAKGDPLIGIPLAISVHGYTGFVLAVIPGKHLWNTALMPFLFLISAMVSGYALVILASILKEKYISNSRYLAERYPQHLKLFNRFFPPCRERGDFRPYQASHRIHYSRSHPDLLRYHCDARLNRGIIPYGNEPSYRKLRCPLSRG